MTRQNTDTTFEADDVRLGSLRLELARRALTGDIDALFAWHLMQQPLALGELRGGE